MKTIFFVRHAKASNPTEGMKDIDRSLDPRGIQSAYEQSTRLQEVFKPELVICSPAARTMHTASIFLRNLNLAESILNLDLNLYYQNHLEYLLPMLKALPNELSTIAIVGHNPGIHEFAQSLSNQEIARFKPGSVAQLTFSTENWMALSANASLEFYSA